MQHLWNPPNKDFSLKLAPAKVLPEPYAALMIQYLGSVFEMNDLGMN